MNVQFVDWGALLALLSLLAGVAGLLATFLWRVINKQSKDMNRRFDKQDTDMGELKTDMAVVKNDLGHVKDDLVQLRDDFGHLRSRCDRMDANVAQMMRDVGRLEGRQQSSSPKDKVGAGGS